MIWSIQIKGFIIGIVFAYLVIPFLMARLEGLRSRQAVPGQ